MNSQYKILLTASLLSGCSTFNIDTFKDLAKSLNPNKNFVAMSSKQEAPGSMIVNLNNDSKQLFRFKSSKNNLTRLVNDYEESLLSFNGKLLRSFGYKNNFNIVYNSKFDEQLYKNGGHIDTFISFSNPQSGILEISYDYKLIKSGTINLGYSNELFEYNLIEEYFEVPKIYWSGKNYYWIDKNMNILKSKQIISPNGNKLYLQALK